MPKKDTDVIAVIIDSDVKVLYRKLCIDNNTSMSEPILTFVKEYISHHTKQPMIS